MLECTEREIDEGMAFEDRDGVMRADVNLNLSALDNDEVDDSSLVGEEAVILDVVSRLGEVVEYDFDVESVAMSDDEIDDAVPEDISRADDDQDDGTLTVEKVDKVVPIEAACFPVPVDVGRDSIGDDDLVFETIVEMPDAVSDVISESSEVEDDGGDDVSFAFTEVERVVLVDVDPVSVPPETIEETVVDAFMPEDVMLYVGVGIEVIPTLGLAPELPPCKEGSDPRPATDDNPPGPKDGVGTAASPEKAVDIESDADSDGTVVALGDVRCGISSG